MMAGGKKGFPSYKYRPTDGNWYGRDTTPYAGTERQKFHVPLNFICGVIYSLLLFQGSYTVSVGESTVSVGEIP